MPDKGAPMLRKRQQIEKVGKNMFVWVACAAVILGICAVLALSLSERISYKQKVISAKSETVGRLESNIKAAKSLKQEVRVINTNQALLSTPRIDGAEPVSVILDALPSTANSSALGASLQQKLLNVEGVTIESLTVDPIAGVEDVSEESSDGMTTTDGEITFKFSVSVASGQASVLQDMLRQIERSIRTINLTKVTVEETGSKITLSAEGRAYYQPAVKVELSEKTVRK